MGGPLKRGGESFFRCGPGHRDRREIDVQKLLADGGGHV